MTSLDDIKAEFIRNVRFQETPLPFTDADYSDLIIEGTKRLYIDEGIEDKFTVEVDTTLNTISRDLTLTEKEYLEVSAEINFYNQIKNNWSTLCSYTTDAISVAGAGNIFKAIDGNVQSLEDRLAQLAFKFTHKQV